MFDRQLDFVSNDSGENAGIHVRTTAEGLVAIGVWIEGDGDYDITLDPAMLDALIDVLQEARTVLSDARS